MPVNAAILDTLANNFEIRLSAAARARQITEPQQIALEEFVKTLRVLNRYPTGDEQYDTARERAMNVARRISQFMERWTSDDIKQATKEIKDAFLDAEVASNVSHEGLKKYVGDLPIKAKSVTTKGVKDAVFSPFDKSKGWDLSAKSVNTELEKHTEDHERAWAREKKQKMQSINNLLASWKEYDDKKTTTTDRRTKEYYDSKQVDIENQLREYGITKVKNPTWFTNGTAGVDELENHLQTTMYDNFESDALHKRRELEKKHGLGRGERIGASPGGVLSGLNSLLGLSDESGFGVVVNVISWIFAWYIAVYKIMSPVLDTFSFFIPFLNILSYPLYLVGIIILHPFIKAILHPFKEDVNALFEHEEGYFGSKKSRARVKGKVKEDVDEDIKNEPTPPP